METNGQDSKAIERHQRDPGIAKKTEKRLAKERSSEVQNEVPTAELQWSLYAAVE